jgi:bacteriocin biosynthesis cyclodehydratase domain-containing protein
LDPTRSHPEVTEVRVVAARRELAGVRVGVIGSEGPGAHAAAILTSCGIEVSRPTVIARDRIKSLARGSRVLVSCLDEGLVAVHHWLNSASLRWGVPVVYAQLDGDTALVGPLVVPNRTACYLCWRMRMVACAESFRGAMAQEEALAARQVVALGGKTVPPRMCLRIGALVAHAALEQLLEPDRQAPVGEVLEVDARRSRTKSHRVLPVPACPSCGVNESVRSQPSLAELAAPRRAPPDCLQAVPSLVSRLCGVITSLQDVRLPGFGEPTTVCLATAELANHQFLEEWSPAQRVCVGKGLTHTAARRGALGEAVERYSGATWSENDVTHGRRAELDRPSLDPRSLVLYRPQQYRQLPYAPYADRTRLGWVAARSLVTGAQLLVPAIGVFLGYRPATREEVLCPTTSNGLAAGATLADAVLAAAYEVLERDLFLVTWMNRLPGERVDPLDHPDRRLVRLCGDYRRCGVELELYRLASDHPCHVFLALGIQRTGGDGPAAAVGLGCDLDPSRAARRAILEVGQARAGFSTRSREVRARIDQLVADPRSVANVQDHGLLYADRRRLSAFEFIRSSPPADVDWTAPGPADSLASLRRLVEHLSAQGDDLLYVNCTPPDMASLGLHTTRVVIPGYQPLHFGANEPRLAGRRLYELPYRLGLTPTLRTPEDLNVDPHPLA